MSIQVTCGECDRTFKVKDRYAGLSGACPYCGAMLIVPSSVPEAVVSTSQSGYELPHALPASSASSLSLMTKVPMRPCPACGKDILVGSPSCFYCGAIPPEDPPGDEAEIAGDQAMLSHIQRLMAQEQARLRTQSDDELPCNTDSASDPRLSISPKAEANTAADAQDSDDEIRP